MKITVLQENLKTALSHVSKAIPAKPPIAILSSIYLRVHPTHLEIAATDLYLGVKSQVLGSDQEEGSLAVPGKILMEVISNLPAGKIEISTNDNALIVSSSSGQTRIQGQVSDDYPPFPIAEGEFTQMSLTDLVTIDSHLRFSVGLDPTRVVLTAILFNFMEQGLEVAATDGFRLAVERFPQAKFPTQKKLLVPAKAISEVCRIAQVEKVDQVSFSSSEELKQLSFIINETQVFVRLVEGEYPPFEKIMPASFITEVEWDGEEFSAHLKRAMIFAREASNIIKLTLNQQDLLLEATSSSYGNYQGKIPLTHHQGDGGQIAFNAKYLMEFMTTLKPDRVWFGMNESLKPALMRPSGLTNYSYVVMPFRVNE